MVVVAVAVLVAVVAVVVVAVLLVVVVAVLVVVLVRFFQFRCSAIVIKRSSDSINGGLK